MADNTYYGAGTYGSGDYQPYAVAPDTAADTETPGAPAAFTIHTAAPGSVGDPESTTGALSGKLERLVDSFDTGTVPDAARWPVVNSGVVLSGGAAQITDATGAYPTLQSAFAYDPVNSFLQAKVGAATPAGPDFSAQTWLFVGNDDNDAVGMLRNGGSLQYVLKVNGSADAYTTIGAYDGAAMAYWRIRHDGTGFRFGYSATGLSWTETAAVTPPWTPSTSSRVTLMVGKWSGSDPAATATFDNLNVIGPAVSTSAVAAPDTLSAAESFGTGTATMATPVTPDSVGDTEGFGTTTASSNDDNTLYGQGTYGQGSYYGYGQPDDQTSTPASVVDLEDIPPVTAAFVANINPNFGYGDGPYGEGTYFGSTDTSTTPDDPTFIEAEPLWRPHEFFPPPQAQHLLGVGPWNPAAVWIGARNYGFGGSRMPARPALALPPTTSKSFTLRVNESSEAHVDLQFNRSDALILHEMSTDLWWQRRDPHTGLLEVIGRFNTSQADLSTSDTGLSLSATFIDYRTLFGDRMLLKYKDVPHSENLWDKGTKIVDILQFALPTNTPVTLDAIADDDPYGLGTIKTPFEIALGATVNEIMANLLAISVKPWEWWVEIPASVTQAPKLMFKVGTRGSDKGVVIADLGIGPTPVAQWSMSNYADRYANTLYFIGADGGDVAQIPDQIPLYGQRDASDSDSSVKGTVDKVTNLPKLLDTAAQKRVQEMADRRPTFTLTMQPGWWRGRSHVDIGDTVTVYFKLGADVITGKYRVTELQCDIDTNGIETVTLTLGTPLTSGDPRSRRSATARIVARLKNYERKDTSS